MTFRLETLGALRLVDPASGAEPLKGRRMELVLLVWLARRSPRPASRDELASLLWESRDDTRARQSLRQALLRLKRELGEVLEVEPESVAIRSGSLELDLTEFEREDSAGVPEQAASRYRGEFLAGIEDLGGETFRLWLEAEREAVRRRAGAVFERLSGRAERDGDSAAALAWTERWCQALPYDERAELRRGTLLRRLGRTPDAMRAHTAYVARIRNELELEPSAEMLQAGTALAAAAAESQETGRRSAAMLEPELVGRGPALQALRTAWREAQAGAARCVVIEGEAGIGKSRLLDEFVRDAGATRSVVLFGAACATDASGLWKSAARLLAPLADAPGLAAAAPESLREAARLLPAIAERFPSLAAGNGPANGGMEPALAAVLREVAVEAPLLLAVDDAHLSDGATRGLLLRLAREEIPNTLILLALRPGHREGTAEFRQAGARLRLQPLSSLQVETLIDGMLSLDAGDRRALADRMVAEGEGNPFYTLELIGAAIDAELLRLDGEGSWRLAPDFARKAIPLSPELRSLIGAELSALSAPARTTLLAAAALGPRFEVETLERVAALPAGDLPGALAELESHRMLRREREGETCAFAHPLLRRVAYESLAPAQRKELLSRRGGSPNPGRRLRVAAAAALLVVAAVASLWIGLSRKPPVVAAAPARDTPRLLVVAFKNETGDPSLNNLGRIAADWVSQGIARTGLVAVVPPALDSAALEMAGDEAATGVGRVRALAAQAKAGLVVSGSFYWVGDSLQLQAVLTDVVQGRVLQAIGPERGIRSNPMPAIERLRQRALGTMAIHLDPRLASFAGQQSTPPSYESYREFAQGLDFWYRRMGGDALPHLTRAYRLDTTFTLPLFYIVGIHRGEGRPRMADSVLKLLEPRRGELAPYDRALLDLYLAKEPGTALIAARAVAEIAPGGSIAGNELPDIAIGLNRPGEALTYLSRLDVDKGEPTRLRVYWARLSAALHLTGQYERQLEIGGLVAERFPEDSRSYYYKARALAAMGRVDEIEVVLREALRLPINPQWGSDGVGLHYVVADELVAHGYPDQARRVVASGLRFCETAPAALQQIPMHRFDLAQLLYRAGRYAEAKAELEHLRATGGGIGTSEMLLRGELGLVAAATGDSAGIAAADQWLREYQDPYSNGNHTEFRARMAALLGRKEDAMRLIRQASGEGYGFGMARHQTREYQSLRGYAPYEELMRVKG